MNLNNQYSRMIRNHGRDFQNLSSSQVIRGYLPAEGPAQFQAGETISPGDLLRDQLEEKQYIIADTAIADGYLAAYLLEYGLTCSITRQATATNAFGRAAADPVTVHSCLPIIVEANRRAAVPAGSSVKQGDIISIDQHGDEYLVKHVSGEGDPGLLVLLVEKQSAVEFAASM